MQKLTRVVSESSLNPAAFSVLPGRNWLSPEPEQVFLPSRSENPVGLRPFGSWDGTSLLSEL